FQSDVTTVSAFYANVLQAAVTPLLLAGTVAYGLLRRPNDQPSRPQAFPRHEAAALIGFVFAPLLFVALAMSSRFLFFPRYGIVCVIGLAGCWSILMFRATAGDRRA